MEEETKGGKGIEASLPSLLFLGTPDFAVPSLRALIEIGAPIRLVITQPDRPSGRGRKISRSPVKILAEDLEIPLYQPQRVRGDEVIDKIRSYQVECAIVVAFGQIVPQQFLDLFPKGTLNVHASLLPKYRGAAPIQRSILMGETLTGISIMQLDAGMDTGPVLSQREVPIYPEDSARNSIRLDRRKDCPAQSGWYSGNLCSARQEGGITDSLESSGKRYYK